MEELSFLSATELARRIQHRELSSVELVAHLLARIARHNPALNAVVTLDAEGAREEAARADAELARGHVRGPLHGVPMTIKDSFEVAGMRTTSGAKVWKDHVPTADAVAVQRLRRAGAIPLGKTNTPAFCVDVQSFNPIFGTTNSPWDLARTPGGSSGGAAAAVAAGLSPVELGSDIGGSIRTPSSFCGVYGHKPSFNLVPQRGHLPGPPGQLSDVDLSVCGPLARTAEDLGLLLDVLAGPADGREKAFSLSLPAPRASTLKQYRVATWFDDAAFPVDDAVRARLEAVADGLRAAGVAVESARPELTLSACYALYRTLLDPIMTLTLPPSAVAMLEQAASDGNADDARTRFARNGLQRHRDWLLAHEERARLRAAFADFFQRYDVLLCPVTMVPAFAHNQEGNNFARTIRVNGATRPYMDLFSWIAPATMCWLPATVAPAGQTAEGLPVGVQIIGPYLEDRTCIDVAARLSDVIGGFVPPPGYGA